MWVHYEPSVVREELEILARNGCNVTRSFCYWPDFVPAPERLDEAVLDRFSDFLDAHGEIGIGTIPTFIVGHMSGENWDPAWRAGRDLYRDVWLVAQQSWFAAEIARHFGAHPAIVGWLVSNEMPLYGGPGSIEEISAWARIVVQAVRSTGATQPVSLGDGAWGVEVSGADNGYSLRALAPLVDFVGPHVYPMSDDPVRQSLAAAFACELASGFGCPVVLEEFGVTSDFVSGPNAAHYYRQVLHTTLAAGATGWIAWNNCDYDDLSGQDPYRHHPFEMHFGLTDGHGAPKPQLGEIARFSRLVAGLGEGYVAARDPIAIVVPEHFERVLPFSSATYRQDMRASLFQSYIAAREADLHVDLVRERDGLGTRHQLYLLPCAKLVTAPTVEHLVERVRAGATAYASYFAGSTDNQRGPWMPWINEIFGVEQQLRYGLVDEIEDDEVTLEMATDLGDLVAGSKLTFSAGGSTRGCAYLPVVAKGAEVLAYDQHGRPSLLRHRLGSGSVVLCTYPIEHLAARTRSVNPESTWRVYAALARAAGVELPASVDDPRVMVSRIISAERETVIVVNLSADSVEAKITTSRDVLLMDPTSPTGTRVDTVSLAPFEVVVLVSDAGSADAG